MERKRFWTEIWGGSQTFPVIGTAYPELTLFSQFISSFMNLVRYAIPFLAGDNGSLGLSQVLVENRIQRADQFAGIVPGEDEWWFDL